MPPLLPNLAAHAKKPGLHDLLLAHYNKTPVAATAEGLLAQFKANNSDESDFDFRLMTIDAGGPILENKAYSCSY